MLRNYKIRPRLLIGFGLLMLMTAALVALGSFGLYAAQQGITGITQQLIPASSVTVAGRARLLEANAASNAMVASIFQEADIKAAKARWDASLQQLDKGVQDFSAFAKTPAQQENLRKFSEHIQQYRAIVTPVAEKLLGNGYADAQEAMAAMKAGDAHYRPAADMLADIEGNLTKASGEVYTKVSGLVSTIFTAFLIAFAVFVAIALLLVWRLAHSIVEPMSAAHAFASRIAAGDLGSAPPQQEGKDEASAMIAALGEMQRSLADIVGQVRQSSESIQVASSEVASGNLDLSSRTEQTASNLEQAASAMEELTGTVHNSAESARSANQLAGSAAQVAQRGGEVVARVVSTMSEINTSSRKINDIIGVIDGIAFQTNILALNAAVEAARAGEQGRGFAVVASEVRNLAQRSAEAAKEIKSLISRSVERVEAGTQLVSDAGQTMGEIVASVQRVSDIIAEISAAAGEQSSGIANINTSVNQLDQMTQQNAALVEESAAAAQSLREQAQKLGTLMSRFRLG